MATKADRYEGIDGLKAYAIIGIALMHVLANGEYGIGGFVFERLIPSFTNLVFLFMMVSGFGMCCGYYQKIIDRKISVEDFYKKRYIKIWPYFALLCALDFVISPSKESLFEVFANLTLCQGLLPNAKISVIGVSWTLAVIFVFYMLFPFFCFLIGNKKRAWGVAVAALVFNWLCSNYFNAGRTNIVYDAVYFIAGGLIFLYRKELAEFASKHKVIAGAILLIATVAYFAVDGNTLTMLFFCVAALIYTLGCKRGGVLVNPVAKFLGGISFEIYLCHMVIYRVLEKLHIIHLFGNGLLAYIFTAVAVICGSVVFSVCAKWFLNKIETTISNDINHELVFLFAGRMVYRKGLDLLFDAIMEIPNEWKYIVKIVGTGPEFSHLKHRCESNSLLAAHIQFMGAVQYSEMQREYELSDVLIMPSIRETTGTVLIEAMSQGIPIITINKFGGAILVDENTGWLYSGENRKSYIDGLKNAMVACIVNPKEVKRRGQNARKKVKEYTWKRKCEQYEKIYKRLNCVD